jgi:hypothetical protein
MIRDLSLTLSWDKEWGRVENSPTDERKWAGLGKVCEDREAYRIVSRGAKG